ncbi:hypothetical protein BVRB_9g223150 [Beta vulgaris subsp. vulgaris]|nr:hypothetical protein BVRB_9g223150 [Beta vulgaris subsp. vulgaris]
MICWFESLVLISHHFRYRPFMLVYLKHHIDYLAQLRRLHQEIYIESTLLLAFPEDMLYVTLFYRKHSHKQIPRGQS